MITKFNYKIFDKSTQKYYSANRKATWTQKHAIIDRLKAISRRTYRPNMDDVEIHIFPLSEAIIKSSADFISENQAEMDLKEAKKLEKERKREVERKEYRVKELERKLVETENELKRLKK